MWECDLSEGSLHVLHILGFFFPFLHPSRDPIHGGKSALFLELPFSAIRVHLEPNFKIRKFAVKL